MRDVDDVRLRRDTGNHAFHDPNVTVAQPKVGHERNNGTGLRRKRLIHDM